MNPFISHALCLWIGAIGGVSIMCLLQISRERGRFDAEDRVSEESQKHHCNCSSVGCRVPGTEGNANEARPLEYKPSDTPQDV